jgi:hypothetical protein
MIHFFKFNHLLIFSSHAPNENEMFEIMPNSNTEVNTNTNQSDSTTSDNTVTDRQHEVK